MPIRNPFASRRPPVVNGGVETNDENAPPLPSSSINSKDERAGYASSRASSALSIKSRREEPNEFKLSVVNDSGVYLPPSPPEKRSFWQRTPTSSTCPSNHRSLLNENEPFSISRESFESYRRSFDISARSPVCHTSSSGPPTPRQSLDSRLPRHPSRTAAFNNGTETFGRPPPTKEEELYGSEADADAPFEDVGLGDEIKQPPLPKKRGIFSRFGDSNNNNNNSGNGNGSSNNASSEPNVTNGDGVGRPTSGYRGFHLPGRKRGHSGQGAELGSIDKAKTNAEQDGG